MRPDPQEYEPRHPSPWNPETLRGPEPCAGRRRKFAEKPIESPRTFPGCFQSARAAGNRLRTDLDAIVTVNRRSVSGMCPSRGGGVAVSDVGPSGGGVRERQPAVFTIEAAA
ncbi:hypothetical protein BN2537_11231 [Streptomyces venezuelae]|nr:hypothetical protein BN2537_11231 [Streptomyces venezuelae]